MAEYKDIYNGSLTFGGNYNVLKDAPIDSRFVRETFADLTDEGQWLFVGKKAYIYKGLLVTVTNDPDGKNGLYEYIGDGTAVTAANWKLIATGNSEGAVMSVTGDDAVTATTTNNKVTLETKISSADKVLTISKGATGGLQANISLSYNSINKTLSLIGKPGVNDKPYVIDTINVSDFIKDGMLDSAIIYTAPATDNPTGTTPGHTYIKFTWNTDNENKINYLDVTTLIDVYNSGELITVDSNKRTINHNATQSDNSTYKLTESTVGSGYGATETINIPSLLIDKYGHVTSITDKTFTFQLPSEQNIWNTIQVPTDSGSSSITASTSSDTLTVKGDDTWISTSIVNEKNVNGVKISHKTKTVTPKDNEEQDYTITSSPVSNIEVPVLTFDNAGHVDTFGTKTYKLTVAPSIRMVEFKPELKSGDYEWQRVHRLNAEDVKNAGSIGLKEKIKIGDVINVYFGSSAMEWGGYSWTESYGYYSSDDWVCNDPNEKVGWSTNQNSNPPIGQYGWAGDLVSSQQNPFAGKLSVVTTETDRETYINSICSSEHPHDLQFGELQIFRLQQLDKPRQSNDGTVTAGDLWGFLNKNSVSEVIGDTITNDQRDNFTNTDFVNIKAVKNGNRVLLQSSIKLATNLDKFEKVNDGLVSASNLTDYLNGKLSNSIKSVTGENNKDISPSSFDTDQYAKVKVSAVTNEGNKNVTLTSDVSIKLAEVNENGSFDLTDSNNGLTLASQVAGFVNKKMTTVTSTASDGITVTETTNGISKNYDITLNLSDKATEGTTTQLSDASNLLKIDTDGKLSISNVWDCGQF